MVQKGHGILRVLGFSVWLAVATLAAATLTAWHSVDLTPGQGLATARSPRDGKWHLTHYLAGDCACSRAVARHLLARGPIGSATEEVFFVGSTETTVENQLLDGLKRSGFHPKVITAEAAASLHGVEGVPLLEIAGPDKTIRYRGGYRERNAAPEEYLDAAIFTRLVASKPVLSARVYGCATSRRLRSRLDPLSLRKLLLP
jgi:hypothetical protein